MTELYLIRHGIAGDRADYNNDEERPLTTKGQEKTTNVAHRISKLGVKFQEIFTSPLVRARQTAEILHKIGLSEKVTEFSALAPDGNLEDWLNWWAKYGYNRSMNSLALVGHQPDLGNWAELLIWGSPQQKLLIKKAGILGLILPNEPNPIGRSELFLLTSPKWLL